MKSTHPIHSEAKRFIDEVINKENSHQLLGKMKFGEIVSHASAMGYAITDTELLNGLNKFYDNKISLPYWLEKRLGGLAIWAAWEER